MYYAVGVSGVSYGAQGLSPSQPPTSTILDSGTTFMYMHSAAFRPFLSALQAVNCPGLKPADASTDEFCVRATVSASAARDEHDDGVILAVRCSLRPHDALTSPTSSPEPGTSEQTACVGSRLRGACTLRRRSTAVTPQ